MNDLASMLLETPQISDNGYRLFNAVLEYYQGKSKELRKCEEYCANIIKKMGDGSSDFNLTKNPVTSADPDVQQLERELAKFFKVNKLRIYWYGSNTVNAFTLPNSCFTRETARRNLLDGKGSNMNINIFVHTNTVTLTGLTGDELLAIILHEIGHNFSYCPVSAFFDIFSWIGSYGLIPILQLIAKGLIIAKAEVFDFVRKHLPVVSNVVDLYNRWSLEFSYLYRPILAPLSVLKSVNPVNILGYGREKEADSFAAMYGYGNQIATALKKMNVPKESMYGKFANATGASKIVADIVELECMLIAGLTLEPHPTVDQRAASLIKKLKSDLASGSYPREVKKELEDEIERLEKTHKTINVINEDVNGPNIRQAIFDVVNKATDNKSDLREIFNFYFDSYRF